MTTRLQEMPLSNSRRSSNGCELT